MKKTPPVKFNKETQTYPLRALPTQDLTKNAEASASPEISSLLTLLPDVKSSELFSETTSKAPVVRISQTFSNMEQLLLSTSFHETSSPLFGTSKAQTTVPTATEAPIRILTESPGSSGLSSIFAKTSLELIHKFPTSSTEITKDIFDNSVASSKNLNANNKLKSANSSSKFIEANEISSTIHSPEAAGNTPNKDPLLHHIPKKFSRIFNNRAPITHRFSDTEIYAPEIAKLLRPENFSNYSFIESSSTLTYLPKNGKRIEKNVNIPSDLKIQKPNKNYLKNLFKSKRFFKTSSHSSEVSKEYPRKPTDAIRNFRKQSRESSFRSSSSLRISPISSSTHTLLGNILKNKTLKTENVLLPSDTNILELKEKYLPRTSTASSTFTPASLQSSVSALPPSIRWIPKLPASIVSFTEKNNTFDFEIPPSQRGPSPSMVATQSYLESQKFFGSLAKPVRSDASRSGDMPTISTPTPGRERITQVIESNSDHFFNSLPYNTAQSKASGFTTASKKKQSFSGKARPSEYSAASSIRRHSNPFMTPHKIEKPTKYEARSVSEALNAPDRSSRGTTLKTHFADSHFKNEDNDSSEEVLPWCKCFFKCCKNFSLFDPVCNIDCCFPYVQIFWVITLILGFLTMWVSMFAIWGQIALPGGEMYEFYTLAVGSYVMGWVFACANIPPSIGMFIGGIAFGNLGWFHTTSSISSATRSIVVTFILLRAGLNTEGAIFKTRGGLVSRMSFIPGISEMLVAAGIALFQFGFTWEWALLLGCAAAPLSPLAIIYSLVRLREDGYGEDKGITSVLLMMYALDNVTLVTLFGIFFTIAFDVKLEDKTAIYLLVLQTFGSIFGGIGVGFFLGTLITFFPHRYDPYCGVWRTILLSCCGLGTVLFSHTLKWDGAGYLCTIVMAFTANTGWKALGTPSYNNPVTIAFAMAWHILQPIALGLIGAEVTIHRLDKHTVYSALYIIPACMMQTRFIMAYLMTSSAGFNRKERLFMAMLSLTKGTPQAALAPMTLDLAHDELQKHFAKHLLTVCVLEVLVTLPLGPLFAAFIGKKLLTKHRASGESQSTYLPRHESWEDDTSTIARRQRYRSIVGRIHNDNEFTLYYSGVGGDNQSTTQ